MVMHPVGPLPAATYWRRRGVLILLVVLLLLVLRACAGGGDGSAKGTGATTTPTPTSSPTPTSTRAPVPSTSARPTASAPPVAAGGACPDGALRLAVTTDAPSYAVGATPRFSLTITNTSTVPCTRDLGSKVVSLRVVSGAARTWDSDDCTEGSASAPTRLAPGVARLVVTLPWSGKRSQPGCPTPREQAAAGTYQVSGTVGTLTSPRVVFHFR